ncbi:aspartate aminotransferase family protein [Leucobacter sp. wl10]|uniref:aspartate aminotransferase family protein n=1 Tax=Leucobacter sp. wl10 TaxID=2304677 RepID=UPI000E5A994B|nr:aminotransferase class III-fold pyridoxal phosphate-dependent enzyme [Leucobacter sp. wl10]RGE16300.1 aminotransferase class III-fold pyridoxal phosphate-dependent enzyme [Leucobacter sp. wl10]
MPLDGPHSRSFDGSLAYRERATRVLARGVSSSPRASQRPVAVLQERASGCTVVDADGNSYTDYALGYGPLLLGHSPVPVLDAVRTELDRGLRTGGVTAGEAELAERIARCVPSGEVSTFLSSGTEAVQLALRIARAGTGRTRIVKFRGHYHGWTDSMHVANSPGSDALTTDGQDPLASANVICLEWGDLEGLQAVLDDTVAAIITEAAAINAGCFEPEAGFLEGLREATRANGSLLIFDEVITGFRLGLGGAQQRYGVFPDLTVLGKVLGGGLPLSAVTGPRTAMHPVVSGAVLHRGTYNGNPLSVAAGNACLDLLERHAEELYPRMEALGAALAAGIRESAERHGKPFAVNHVGTCLQFFVSERPITRLTDLIGLDKDRILEFSEQLVRRGVITLPRGLMYLSTEHTDADIEATISAFDDALSSLAN